MKKIIEYVFVEDITRRLELEPIIEFTEKQRPILDASVSRPSFELSGIFDFFKPNRIQIFGSEEQQTLDKLIQIEDFENIDTILQYNSIPGNEIPMIIFSRDYHPPQEFIERCRKYKVPIYCSPLNSTMLIANLSQTLREYFAPQTNVHGVMLEVCGIGVLIQGKSSIGKSETALELITRGRTRLIADDRVILYEIEPGMLIARAPKVLEHMIEIRGIGVVDVMAMYGGAAIKPSKKLSLVIQLQNWDKNYQYNRIGAEVEYVKFLETQVAQIILPVHVGRNVASLIETAALNHQLKEQGYNASEKFMARLSEAISDNSYYTQELEPLVDREPEHPHPENTVTKPEGGK